MFVYTLFAKAQARYPKYVGAVMRKVMALMPKLSKKKTKPLGRTSGVAAANKAARVKAVGTRDPKRTNGVLAANKAAGVPGAN